VETTLFAAQKTLGHAGWVDPRVETKQFRTFNELHDGVKAYAETGRFDFICMPAAISDYQPIPVQGKIRSTVRW
jgi:hypothetical protein